MAGQSVLKIGHRGAAGSRPEHTKPSFAHAMDMGVDMIELDIQLTRDGRLVVVHDRELGRTLPGGGPVRDCTFDQLRILDAGSWFDPAYAGERVLSLEDVLHLTSGRVDLNVEIKSPEPDWAGTAAVLAELLERHGRLKSTIVSCFELGALRCMRATARSVRLGVLWETADLEGMWRAAEELNATSVHPHWALVEANVVAAARSSRLAVITWTVNDARLMGELIELGVDGIISDFPERFPGSPTVTVSRERQPS
jgi:glycerophosphoryl diester phosphodiesterase